MRNPTIDAYRVLLMFGICLLHAISQGGHNTVWAANALEWCVPGFVLMSGWFGIRFSWSKFLRLYGTSLYCATVFCGFDLIAGDGVFSFARIWSTTVSQWFLNAYAVLMCFAPLLNEACKVVVEKGREDRRVLITMVIPLLICVFGWSFATSLPYVSAYLPMPTGFSGYSFLMMIGVYVVGRLLRGFEDNGMLDFGSRTYLIILVVSLPCAAVGMGDYHSPFAVGIAVSTFFLFKALVLPTWIGRACVLLAPSMFSVYLLHSHGQAWGYVRYLEDLALVRSMPTGVAYLFAAVCVMCACVLLDVPRRLVGCCKGGRK